MCHHFIFSETFFIFVWCLQNSKGGGAHGRRGRRIAHLHVSHKRSCSPIYRYWGSWGKLGAVSLFPLQEQNAERRKPISTAATRPDSRSNSRRGAGTRESLPLGSGHLLGRGAPASRVPGLTADKRGSEPFFRSPRPFGLSLFLRLRCCYGFTVIVRQLGDVRTS